MFTENGRLNELTKPKPDIEFSYVRTIFFGTGQYGFDFKFLSKIVERTVLNILNKNKTALVTKSVFLALYDICNELVVKFPMDGYFIKNNTLMSGYMTFNNPYFDLVLDSINHEKFSYNGVTSLTDNIVLNCHALNYIKT